MGYAPRWFEAGRLYETTSRTIHSRLLLKPSEELNTILRGVLARAVRKYQVEVCYFIVMSNHMHLMLIARDAIQMSRFMNFVDANIAKEAGRLHGWKEKFWGRRYKLIAITDEPEAQIARLRYLLAHGCKEGLVRKPSEWPGASGVDALLTGAPVVGHWFDRTAAYRARRRGEKVGPWDFADEESFTLAPLPCWAELTAAQRQGHAKALIDEIEQETRDRLSTENRSPVGVRRILSQHPHGQPASTKRSPAPLVHAASTESWIIYKRLWLHFRDCYREAADRLRRGDLQVLFPAGSIPPPLPTARTELPRRLAPT